MRGVINLVKLLLIGASAFTENCLRKIIEINGIDVVGIISNASSFKISYSKSEVKNVLHKDLSNFAEGLQIPFICLKEGMNERGLFERVCQLAPDIILVAGWYHMIPKKWMNTWKIFGMHASLLPKYRGGAPLVWAMINGEEYAGISLFLLNKGVDTGPIVGQLKVKILPTDTIATLYAKIERLAEKLLEIQLPLISKGQEKYLPNGNEFEVMPQRTPDDGLICWNNSVNFIDRFIRAQTRPYPGAFFIFKEQKITIWSAEQTFLDVLGKPGRLSVMSNNAVLIECLDGYIKLLEVEIEGKSYRDFEIAEKISNLFVEQNSNLISNE